MALDDENQKIPIVGEAQSNRIHGSTCRICLKPKQCLISIYDEFFEDLCYKEIYKECIGQPLKNFTSNLPLICQDCEDDLLQAFKFRKMCLEAEDALNELEHSSIQIKSEIVEENLSTNEMQDAEESRLIISSVMSGMDNHNSELMDIENNQEECLQADEWLEEQNDKIAPLTTEIKIENEDISLQLDVMSNSEQQDEEEQHANTSQNNEQSVISTKDMETTETTYNPEKSCRICLQIRYILLPFKDGVFEGIPYKEIYQECMRRPLKEYKDYPSFICQLCEGDLLQSFKFRKKCLDAEEKLTDLAINLFMKMNYLPTISSNKTDTNLPNDVPENKKIADEIEPPKKAKIYEDKTDKTVDKIKKVASTKGREGLRSLSRVPKLMLVKLDQSTVLKESSKEPNETQGTNKIAKKATTKTSEFVKNLKTVKTSGFDKEPRFRKRKNCEKCSKTFNIPEIFKWHMKTHDENIKYVRCNICKKNVAKLIFEKHMKFHKRNKHTADSQMTYSCPQCPKMFMTEAGLKYHTSNTHTISKMEKCPICSKPVKKVFMKYHIHNHKGKIRNKTSTS